MKELFDRADMDLILQRRELHIILDALPTPISWAAMPSGEIRFTNRAFRKTFGYPEGQFKTVDDWISQTYVHESQQAISRARWLKLWLAEQSGISEVSPIEVEVRCADGTLLTIQHRGILLHDINVAIASFEDITAHKQVEQALNRIAFEDPLTGLANRRALQERWMHEIEPAQMYRSPFIAVLLLDLDGFKGVNDRFGHDVGDDTLVVTAQRLRSCVRAHDVVCRLGGDEFAILLPHLEHPQQAAHICQRITDAMQEPFKLAGYSFSLGASAGVSLYPQHGCTLHDLMKCADTALYRIKKARKGGWGWYAPPPPELPSHEPAHTGPWQKGE